MQVCINEKITEHGALVRRWGGGMIYENILVQSKTFITDTSEERTHLYLENAFQLRSIIFFYI